MKKTCYLFDSYLQIREIIGSTAICRPTICRPTICRPTINRPTIHRLLKNDDKSTDDKSTDDKSTDDKSTNLLAEFLQHRPPIDQFFTTSTPVFFRPNVENVKN
jgi:hypothetical protein